MEIEKLPVVESGTPQVPDEVKEYQEKWKEENEGKEGIIIH